MADLQTNLQRLENNSDEISSLVTDISDAIIAKGGSLPSNAGLRSFPAAIAAIPDVGNIATKTDTTGSGIKFIGDGNPLIRCDIEGNMNQQGTPSQSSPIYPGETGDKTANLWDNATAIDTDKYISDNGQTYKGSNDDRFLQHVFSVLPSEEYYVSWQTAVPGTDRNLPYVRISYFDGATFISRTLVNSSTQRDGASFTIPNNCNNIDIRIDSVTSARGQHFEGFMLNAGSTALPYEPFGYKIPVLSGGVTTPKYLGEVQSTRQIRKVVLTGNEEWTYYVFIGNICFFTDIAMSESQLPIDAASGICSHYIFRTRPQNLSIYFARPSSNGNVILFDERFNTADAFKTYLAQQYAAGTPVTIWYVLAEPTTGIVNEPIRKIGDYADSVSVTGIPTVAGLNEFQVTTTLPPSKTTIEYRYIENIPTLDSKTITTNGTYNASDDNLDGYSSVTVNVSSGGAGDVNFYDYDGSIVKSYSAEEFANLSALPANPTHTGLTAQGWNWTLADAKTYVAANGKLDIGQQYVTNDGKTRIYINLPEGRISPLMMLYLNDNTELDIDWGDGSAHSTWTTTTEDYKSERHTYPDKGKYVIAIKVVSGSFILQSQQTSYNTFFTDGKNSSNSSDRAYLNSIQKIEIGTGVTTIGSLAFSRCSSLSSVTIPSSVTSIGNSAFSRCTSLYSVTIPDGVTTIGSNAFNGCYSLSSITIPNSVTSIGSSAFSDCYSLSSIIIPDGVTTIGSYAFCDCQTLSSITIPDGVTAINDYVFENCYSLSSITIPNNVTIIERYAFRYCNSMDYIKFTRSAPPTVQYSDTFENVSTSTILYIPALTSNLYMNETNYPAKTSYKYIGYATYTSGEELPSTTTDETYTLTWYATSADAIAETNPITVGNGNEIYARLTSHQHLAWVAKTWTGLTDFNGNDVWLDGTDIYYSAGNNVDYYLDKSTSTWRNTFWDYDSSHIDPIRGENIITVGSKAYYICENEFEPGLYIPDKFYYEWEIICDLGELTEYGEYGPINKDMFWTDGVDLFYSDSEHDDCQYIFDTDSAEIMPLHWDPMSDFDAEHLDGRYIWTDGINMYYSPGSNEHYVLNKATLMWTTKTFINTPQSFNPTHVWRDGQYVYYNDEYVLDTSTSTWSAVTFTNTPNNFSTSLIWSDDTHTYYSDGSSNQSVLE